MTKRAKEPSTTLCVSIPKALDTWVREQAVKEDKQVSRIVRRALKREQATLVKRARHER